MDDPFSFLDIDSRLSGRFVFFVFRSLSCCLSFVVNKVFHFFSKNKRVFESKTTTQQFLSFPHPSRQSDPNSKVSDLNSKV